MNTLTRIALLEIKDKLDGLSNKGDWKTSEGFGGVWVVTGGNGDFAVHPSTSNMPGVVLGSGPSQWKDAQFVAEAPGIIRDLIAIIEGT